VIKTIFFDWFNTLACYDPPREELHSRALREFGIEVSPGEILPGLLLADKNWFEENIRSKIENRSLQEQAELRIHYEETMLAKAGIKVPKETLGKIMERVQQLYQGMTFVLFDDVLPVLKVLKQQNFIMGLLTNLAKNMDNTCRELGLEPYLDVVVTSEEAGADKPSPLIFQMALQRAGVDASEAVHVGDQYNMDVLGARGVGITPILIDRYSLYPEVKDCPQIRTLHELSGYL